MNLKITILKLVEARVYSHIVSNLQEKYVDPSNRMFIKLPYLDVPGS